MRRLENIYRNIFGIDNDHRDVDALITQAKEVLDKNWTGSFTVPAASMYPHQWSWDSAFIAIGNAHFNQERAQQELRRLFSGQ